MKKLFPKSVVLLSCLFASLLSFNSCTKNSYDKVVAFQMDPTFNIGMISGTVGFSNLNNILSDSNSSLKFGNDSSVTFYWKGNISSFTTTDFIPSFTSNPNVFSLDVNNRTILQNAPANIPFTVSDAQSLNITPVRAQSIDIDSIWLKSGIVQIVVNNTFNEPCKIVLSVPGIIQSNGKLFTDTFVVKANAISIDSIDISNKKIDMTNGGTTTNNLLVNYSITLTKVKSGAEPNGNLTFTQQINHPVMKLMFADVHHQNFFTSRVANIPLNAFKIQQLSSNAIKFTNDTINLNFSNTFGVPMSFSFTQLMGKDANNQPHYLNVGGITPSTFLIPASTSLGVAAKTTMSLNNNNPATVGSLLSIPDFLSTLPTSIMPQFSAVSNPGTAPKNVNFIKDDSKGSIDAQIIIPLDMKINSFITKDTFNFYLGDMGKVDSFTLRLSLNNGMPLGLGATLSLVDSTVKPYKVIYTMSDTLLKPAIIDPVSNKVISKTLNIKDFILGSKVMPLLKKVNKIIFKGTLSSPSSGNQSAKIYSNQTIDINIGAKAHYKMN